MKYSVTTLRTAGLEARWTKNQRGAPIILARDPNAPSEHQRTTWWFVDGSMWDRMAKVGISKAFREHTLLGDIFSVPV